MGSSYGAKIGLIRCTETEKPLFTAQQLRGPASTWWEKILAIQPAGHLVTWAEFKQAFRGFTDEPGGVHMFEARGRLSNAVSQQVYSSLPVCYRPSGHGFEKNCFMRGLNDRL
jgi:hypothetical protein